MLASLNNVKLFIFCYNFISTSDNATARFPSSSPSPEVLFYSAHLLLESVSPAWRQFSLAQDIRTHTHLVFTKYKSK